MNLGSLTLLTPEVCSMKAVRQGVGFIGGSTSTYKIKKHTKKSIYIYICIYIYMYIHSVYRVEGVGFGGAWGSGQDVLRVHDMTLSRKRKCPQSPDPKSHRRCQGCYERSAP